MTGVRGGRPRRKVASVKPAAAVARAQEKEREKEKRKKLTWVLSTN
jgi:hypothetical protein